MVTVEILRMAGVYVAQWKKEAVADEGQRLEGKGQRQAHTRNVKRSMIG